MTSNIYDIAKSYLGVEEIKGPNHNQKIVDFFKASGLGWIEDDETPWCAGFVGAVLSYAGIRGTGKANARSYLDWGEEVPLKDARKGDVVVFWRESRDSWKGHVAFYDSHDEKSIRVLGGNQGDAVTLTNYPRSRLLSVRRYPEPRKNPAQSKTLQATATTAAAAVGTVAAGVGSLDQGAQIAVIALGAVALLGLAFIARERLRKWGRGDR